MLTRFFIKEFIYRSLRNRHEAHLLQEAHTPQRSRDSPVLNERYRDSSTLAMIERAIISTTLQPSLYERFSVDVLQIVCELAKNFSCISTANVFNQAQYFDGVTYFVTYYNPYI